MDDFILIAAFNSYIFLHHYNLVRMGEADVLCQLPKRNQLEHHPLCVKP